MNRVTDLQPPQIRSFQRLWAHPLLNIIFPAIQMGVTKSPDNPLTGPQGQDRALRAAYEADFQRLVLGPNDPPYHHQGDRRIRDKIMDIIT